MNAYLTSNLRCEYCGCVMGVTQEVKDHQVVGVYVTCGSPPCKYYEIKFHAPQMELKEA